MSITLHSGTVGLTGLRRLRETIKLSARALLHREAADGWLQLLNSSPLFSDLVADHPDERKARDRLEYLQDAIEECNRQSLHFIGILFKGVEQIPGEPDPKIAEFQKQYLLDHAQWLEDEQAQEKVEKNSH